ncbi:MAG TPA: prepilin peptidase [Candidatus Saccharimonadales bacterium]|nr:prepilin peptidase [Candidatus Saccharimonadales bacterium]
MIVLVLIVLGLCFGSFVNALTWRLHERRNWVSERSECPHCHHRLAAKDLVPVFSWLSLGGKCRYCKKPIPDTPLAELLVPVLFVLSYLYWPLPLHGDGLFRFVVWLVFVIAFVTLALYDLKWYLLPDKIVFPLVYLTLAQLLVSLFIFKQPIHMLVGSLAGVAVISGLFALLFYASKGQWIGFGDVKLGLVLGALAGGVQQAVLLLFIASVAGTLVALPMLVTGKAGRKTHVPFGPLLLFGMVIVQLWGSGIISWYTQALLHI